MYKRQVADEDISTVFDLIDKTWEKSSDWTKTAEPSKLLTDKLSNGVTYMLRWHHYKIKDGVEYYLLAGTMWTTRAHLIVYTYLPNAEEAANLNDAVAAVFSLR